MVSVRVRKITVSVIASKPRFLRIMLKNNTITVFKGMLQLQEECFIHI